MSSPFGAIVLAGGGSRRFGETDKRLARLSGTRLIDRAVSIAGRKADAVVISLGSGEKGLKSWKATAPIVSDAPPGDQGPLAGVLAGLSWFKREHSELAYCVTFPADTPFLPQDYETRLLGKTNGKINFADYKGRAHFICAGWPVACIPTLAEFLQAGERRAEKFIRNYGSFSVDFSDYENNPFFNINTPEDLNAAAARIKQ